MLNTKLILVEGLAGTGKSTMAQFIEDQFKKNGFNARWYHEGNDDHFFWIPLTGLFDGEYFTSEENRNAFMPIILKTCHEMVEVSQKENKVFIFDVLFYHGIASTLDLNGFSQNEIAEYLKQVETILAPMNPLIVFYTTEQIRKHTNSTWDKRCKWGKDEIIKFCEEIPFIKALGLKGDDALVCENERYQNLAKYLFDLSELNKITFVMDNENYQEYRKMVLNKLDLKYISNDFVVADQTGYLGIYDDLNENDPSNMVIRIVDNELICDWGRKNLVLDPVETNVFSLRSYPTYLRFTKDETGVFTGIETFGHQAYQRSGCIFKRVEISKYPLLD